MIETPLIIAFISAGISIVTLAMNQRSVVRNRETEARINRARHLSSVREPLAHAAFELQSRLYNLLRGGFHDAYLCDVEGDAERERRAWFSIQHTSYLFAQSLYWSDRLRREFETADLDSYPWSRALVRIDADLRSILRNDAQRFWQGHEPPFMVFEGEQRSIAEIMTIRDGSGTVCRGFNAFLEDDAVQQHKTIQYVARTITEWDRQAKGTYRKFEILQFRLLDLVRAADPEMRRFPANLLHAIAPEHEADYRSHLEAVETQGTPRPDIPVMRRYAAWPMKLR